MKTIVKRIKLNFNGNDLAELDVEYEAKSAKELISKEHPELHTYEKKDLRIISDKYLILVFGVKRPTQAFYANNR